MFWSVRFLLVVFGLVSAAFAAAAQQSTVVPVPGSSLTVRVEQAEPFKMATEQKSTLVAILTGPFGGGIAGAIAASAGVWIAHRAGRSTLQQKSNEAEVKEIQERLNSFYGPFELRSSENKLISGEFRRKQGDKDFRTLVALLNPTWKDGLSNADKNLLKRMIDNGIALNTLIRDKSGYVNPSLLPVLAKTSAHFTMLDLAYNNQLDDDPARFGDYAYPRELDEAINKEIVSLNQRVDRLLRDPGRKHPQGRYGTSPASRFSRGTAVIATVVALVPLAFPVISFVVEGAFPQSSLPLSNAFAAGIAGLASSLFWIISAGDEANKTANGAAAGFSGATVTFGVGTIMLPNQSPNFQWLVDHWATTAFCFGLFLAVTTATMAWRKS
ncbi:hypothetical protein [Rhizobium leguminosarum]|uniref:hypothetical protein n=1 Tax=Rhizobium leguminosarum TaxID=384 RepID=UPI00140F98FA|nr:hypothetical protein [Rhizobium leguminosarum]QIO61590.1 hypothetical protein HA463_28125 [Rhizobium leguminosarum bv. trifolii]